MRGRAEGGGEQGIHAVLRGSCTVQQGRLMAVARGVTEALGDWGCQRPLWDRVGVAVVRPRGTGSHWAFRALRGGGGAQGALEAAIGRSRGSAGCPRPGAQGAYTGGGGAIRGCLGGGGLWRLLAVVVGACKGGTGRRGGHELWGASGPPEVVARCTRAPQ